MNSKLPQPPKHLSAKSARFFREIVADHDLQPQHLALLTGAAEAMDRCEEARRRLAADGCYLVDRYGGLRAHPAVGVERDSRLAVARFLRELKLEDDDE